MYQDEQVSPEEQVPEEPTMESPPPEGTMAPEEPAMESEPPEGTVPPGETPEEHVVRLALDQINRLLRVQSNQLLKGLSARALRWIACHLGQDRNVVFGSCPTNQRLAQVPMESGRRRLLSRLNCGNYFVAARRVDFRFHQPVRSRGKGRVGG